jgi:hypothetical protein
MKNKIKVFFLSLFIIFPARVLAQYPIVASKKVSSDSFSPLIFNAAKQMIVLVLGIVGVLAIFGFVLSLVLYVTAAGDEERIGAGAKVFKTSLVQVFIVIFGLILVFFAQKVLAG